MRETWLFYFNNMKIMILPYAAGLTEILSGELQEFGLAAERIDYNKPILTQITDADADYISIHILLTDETRDLIGAKEMNLMKRSAFLINVARAQIVDRAALFTSLVNKKIAGAAFDVFWEEPADPNDKLLKLDNFVLTPHLAGWTTESAKATTELIAANIN